MDTNEKYIDKENNANSPGHVRPILVSFLNFIGVINTILWFSFILASYVAKHKLVSTTASEEAFLSFVFMLSVGAGVISSTFLFSAAFIANHINKTSHYAQIASDKLFEIERWIAARERR